MTENITNTNILIKAVIVYIGPNACGSRNENESEPWWKRRIKMINEVRKHINILERHQNEEIRRKEKNEEFKKEYFIKKNGTRLEKSLLIEGWY